MKIGLRHLLEKPGNKSLCRLAQALAKLLDDPILINLYVCHGAILGGLNRDCHTQLQNYALLPSVAAMPGRTVITIGNFDGVHLGHRALIRAAVDAAGSGGRVVAMAFDPHPATVLRPLAVPPRLTTLAQRTRLALRAGVSEMVALDPTAELLGTSPEDFIARVVRRHHPGVVVEGPDFRFGHERRGDVDLLARLGAEQGFAVIVVPPAQGVLSDHSIVTVSSSLVRWMLEHGRVEDVRRLLGRPYEVRGIVAAGDKRGRQLGVPTANVAAETMLPGDGVYFGRATASDGAWHGAAINIGLRPTFGEGRRACEVHLLDVELPLDEYGWECAVCFEGFLRNEIRFDGASAVQQQIGRDINRTRDLLARCQEAP